MTPEEKNDLCEKAFKSIYPSCGCKDTDLLESLKDILGNDRAERIKNVNRYNKPVLFISNNISLIRGAVSYLWYTQGQDMPPHVLSCSGLREEEVLAKLNGDWIETAFKNIEFCTYLCGVLFFEDLNPYENILRQLWAKVEDNKDPGILVISMGNIGNLSQGLLDRFEVIELDAMKQIISDSTPASTPKDTPAGQNVFRWNGGTWEITFDGKTIRPPDSFGLKYIHSLLKHPDKEIYATELRLITGTQLRERSNKSYDEEKKDNEESSGIESGDKMNKILDSTSIEEIKRAIGYLSEQLVGAEEGEKAELLDKKTSLELHLKKATNINADSRDFSTDLEKARKAVSKCITNSLEIIKKEHTTLEKYLSVTIKMGNVFQYKHTSKIDWQLS